MWSPTFVPKPADWPSWCVVAGTYSLKQGGKSFDASKFEALSAWLRSGPPPIFVGFGSMVIRQPEELASMIVEAARRARRRVLVQSGWSQIDVSETTSNGDDGTPLCFNVGPAPHDWLLPQVLPPLPVGAYTPPSLLAPHDWLLPQVLPRLPVGAYAPPPSGAARLAALLPQVCAVIHHGGAGTTAAGLLAGKPTLVCPFFGDQYMWGEMVRRAGAAGWSTWPSWRGRSGPPRAHQAASEGVGLPSALVSRGPAPQTPPRGRGLSARGRPSRRLRCL